MSKLRMVLSEKRKKNKKKRLLSITVYAIYILIFALVGLRFTGTYSIYTTLARTPASEVGTIGDSGILEIETDFAAEEWLNSGASGLKFTNVTAGKMWIYFSIEGNLVEAIQHINPICLAAGKTYEVPIIPINSAPLNELGLLGWRNNQQIFSGKIIARVLNNYSSYQVGTVVLKGAEIYEKMVTQQDDPEQQLLEIKSVNDILLVLADRASLRAERDDLLQRQAELLKTNEGLERENSSLHRRINSLEDQIDSAWRKIDELQQPSVPEAPFGGGTMPEPEPIKTPTNNSSEEPKADTIPDIPAVAPQEPAEKQAEPTPEPLELE